MTLRLIPAQEGTPLTAGASLWDILRSRLREMVGALLNRMGLPGGIRRIQYDDPVTGDLFEVIIGPLFTRVSFNGRDYYFDRVTGRFDGTGQACG